MLERFLLLKEFIDPMDEELAGLMPTPAELVVLQRVLNDLVNFQSITLELQSDS
jgi:hypothetical protein